MESRELTYLAQCRAMVEERLDWGPASEWSTQDFEELSDMIATETGRTLGATTLKRVWGRVRYESSPSQHTLDTLAQFVGSSSWRSLKRDGAVAENQSAATPPLTTPAGAEGVGEDLGSGRGQETASPRVWGAVAMLVLLLIFVGSFFYEGNPAIAESTLVNVQFSSRPVSTGIPNSVVFTYSLAGVEADSFFIQQSWDARLRDRVLSENTEFTSIYYYPGHFWAKLVANDTVLREFPLVVPSDGWLGLIEREGPIPIYVDLEEDLSQLQVSEGWIGKNVADIGSGEHIVNYFNVGTFEPLPSTSAVFHSEIKVDVDPGFSVCRNAVLVMIGQSGRISIPFSLPGCVANLYVVAGDKEVPGRTNDLSSLGTDLANWTDVTIGVKDRLVFVEIDGESTFQVAYSEEIGDIVGLRYRFAGHGKVRNVSLSDGAGNTVLTGYTD